MTSTANRVVFFCYAQLTVVKFTAAYERGRYSSIIIRQKKKFLPPCISPNSLFPQPEDHFLPFQLHSLPEMTFVF